MTIAAPPRRPESDDRDLEQRVADLEALIEEARRRARRRRQRSGAAALLIAAAGVAVFIGFGGHGGGSGGAAALTHHSGAGSEARTASSLGALPAGARPSVFAFDPRRPNVVYVTSAHDRRGAYVYKTIDGGRHWHPTGARGTGWISDDLSLTADPRHTGTLYAGTDTAVYKTVDGGRSWRPFSKGLFPPHGGRRVCRGSAKPYCLKLPAGTPGTIGWNRNNGWVLAVAVDPSDRHIVYSASDAVRKSVDGGHTWKTVLLPNQAPFATVTRLAIARTRPESIYAIAHGSTGHTAIYKSRDAGRTWHATGSRTWVFPNSDDGDSTDALAVDAQHPDTIYAATGHTVVETTDAGRSWRSVSSNLPASVTSLAADPTRSGTLYAGLGAADGTGAIYKTTNGGLRWTKAESGPYVATLAVDPARPATIWAVGVHWSRQNGSVQDKFFIKRSTDYGHTWATAP